MRIGAAAVVGVAALVAVGGRVRKRAAPEAPLPSPHIDDAYARSVQPVFDRRCVVCHSCYDSPCQLNLQAFEGLDRGANPRPVYDPSRFEATHPTRLFEDAQTTEEWRTRFGFFPVVARQDSSRGDLDASLLWRALMQRAQVAERVTVDIDKATACPADVGALGRLLAADPGKGMPYGFPPLNERDYSIVAQWIHSGAGRPEPLDHLTEAAQSEIARWEAFMNGRDAKTRIIARYLFEHLFLAHLGIESAPGRWFRLVRSRTAAPAPVDEIATVRPYDDPRSGEVHYRLRPLRETIVEKSHAPYLLSDAKLARLRQIFLEVDWEDASPAFPSYARDVAANPFVAYRSIPARSRYQFLLDDAYYHVETFIHGPVCKGQVALNVIGEHFLIFFLSPNADPAVTDPGFLPHVAGDLTVPAEGGDGVEAVYERFKLLELAYLRHRAEWLRARNVPGRSLTDVWDGDGTHRDAVLTVYRHFDSASVIRGAVGGVPKTAWVLDYPILERMYYDLVAGFDVFGAIVHQVSTRRYMNLLRVEAEGMFLAFLPASQREAVRDFWYRPPDVAKAADLLEPIYAAPETRVAFADPTRAKKELVTRLVTSVLPPEVIGEREPVQWGDVFIAGDDPASRFERAARAVVARAAPFVRAFPDAAVLRLRSGGPDDPLYTIVRNKEHLNIDFMFAEQEERVPTEDTLHVVRGVVVSRPNLFLSVGAADIERFFTDLGKLVPGDDSWSRFLDRYGIRRSDPGFWGASDFVNARFARMDPVAAGILDLSRYSND